MTMVGLFWITTDEVYVGAPPGTDGLGARLTEKGVEADGAGVHRTWAWEQLRSATVEGALVRSASRRRLTLAMEVVLTAAMGGTAEPEPMLLRLETVTGVEELTVYASAAGAYEQEEFDLSQRLLARFVEGAESPRTLMAWSGEAGDTNLKPSERRALLRKWTGG
ncbi:hypothetical protein ACFV46_31840 [Streptomyces sp. NPDC059852]|uniref:hypothetical protein n=1 Tax=Streptomyces sp. NPDC059852 TaxID=3346972 RepID=UPI003669A552